MEGVILRLILALITSAQFVTAQAAGVRWNKIDPFCGQIVSARPESFPIKSATVRLYRATEKHHPCCASAKQVDEFQINKAGEFDLRKLAPGQYWMVIRWEEVEAQVALWSDGKHDFACNETYRNIIKVDASTKTTELYTVVSNNDLNDAQTH